jgi:serine/threonine protein kinase
MNHFEDRIEPDIIKTYKYMPPETNLFFANLYSNPYDNYSLGITFIERAFAFHCWEKYSKIIASSSASSSLFDSVLRYVPPNESQPCELESDTLKLYSHRYERYLGIEFHGVDHEMKTVICSLGLETEYTLGDLYKDICKIHERYPLFRKMIEIDPVKRYSINNVIKECQSIPMI